MTEILRIFVTSLLIALVWPANAAESKAKFAVVVHAKNNSKLTDQDIARIFLGKVKNFPKDGKATPIMRSTMTGIAKAFLKRFLRKRPSQYKSYWMNMVFTGEGNPPKEISDEGKVLKEVRANQQIIGIVHLSSVDGKMRVIAKF